MARPLVVGIDPATNTGICEGRVGETPTLSAQRFRVSRKDKIEDIFGRATHHFADYFRTLTPDVVAVEHPVRITAGYGNAATDALKFGLYGVITGIVKAKGYTLLTPEIATWRKFFLNHGRMAKLEAKQAAMQRCAWLKWDAPTIDAAEAAGIWSWGCSQIDPKHAHRIEPLFARVSP